MQTAHRLKTESAISAGLPSDPTKILPRRLGLQDKSDKQPAAVLAELHRGLGQGDEAEILFALAELSFLHAEQTNDQAYYLASAIYAWASFRG